jgi:DNA repair protein RAD50
MYGARDDLHRKVERMQEDYNHLKDDLTSCMLQWHTRREEKIKALNMLTEFNRKKAERQKVEDEISQATMDVEIYEQALGPAKREKERIELEHLEFKKAKSDEENIRLQELNAFGKEADKLRNTAASVHKFVLSRKDEQLRAVNERLLRKKVEQEEKTAQLNSMQKEYATLKGLIGNQAELKRKIDDNLQYRETRNKEEQMREQIEHLEQQLVSKGELLVLEAGLKRVLSELQSLLSEVISFF